jgi:hypothetical protein
MFDHEPEKAVASCRVTIFAGEAPLSVYWKLRRRQTPIFVLFEPIDERDERVEGGEGRPHSHEIAVQPVQPCESAPLAECRVKKIRAFPVISLLL